MRNTRHGRRPSAATNKRGKAPSALWGTAGPKAVRPPQSTTIAVNRRELPDRYQRMEKYARGHFAF